MSVLLMTSLPILNLDDPMLSCVFRCSSFQGPQRPSQEGLIANVDFVYLAEALAGTGILLSH